MSQKKYFKNIDFFLLFLIILITGFGIIGIALATRSPLEGAEDVVSAIGSFNLQQVKLQILWLVTGLVIMGVVISVDYHIITDISVYFYWIVVGLLIAVELFGSIGGGAQRWIAIGPFRMQPSEFTKITVILMLARIMAKEEESGVNNLKTIIRLVLALGVPLGLILKQPDLGTSMVLVNICWYDFCSRY